MNNEDTIPCFECDGRLEIVPQTIIKKIDGVEYIINDVPVHKCDTCGHESFSAAASSVIEAALPERPMRGPRRLKDS
jgi:YgiT-type zinc finger domain-containing protein